MVNKQSTIRIICIGDGYGSSRGMQIGFAYAQFGGWLVFGRENCDQYICLELSTQISEVRTPEIFALIT